MSRSSAAAFEAQLVEREIPNELAGLDLYSWSVSDLQKAIKDLGGRVKSGTLKIDLCAQLRRMKPQGFERKDFKRREWTALRNTTKPKLATKSAVTKASQNQPAEKKRNVGIVALGETGRRLAAITTSSRRSRLLAEVDDYHNKMEGGMAGEAEEMDENIDEEPVSYHAPFQTSATGNPLGNNFSRSRAPFTQPRPFDFPTGIRPQLTTRRPESLTRRPEFTTRRRVDGAEGFTLSGPTRFNDQVNALPQAAPRHSAFSAAAFSPPGFHFGPPIAAAVPQSAMRHQALREAAIREEHFRNATIREAAFREAAFREAAFREADFREADFWEAAFNPPGFGLGPRTVAAAPEITALSQRIRTANPDPRGINFGARVAEAAPSPHPRAAAPPAKIPRISPQRLRSCQVCFEDVTAANRRQRATTSACSHEEDSICLSCLQQSIAAQAASKPWDNISCPVLGCSAILEHKDLRIFASTEVFNRYDTFISKQVMEGIEGFVSCSATACGDGGLVDPNDTFFTCSSCRAVTCIQCNTPYHPGLTHEQNQQNQHDRAERESPQARQQRQEEEMASEDLIWQTSKACPNPDGSCGARIEKSYGCDHMTCRRCHYEFCWVCLADFNAIRRRGNHQHKADCKYYYPITRGQ